jgi:hypothetical protein
LQHLGVYAGVVVAREAGSFTHAANVLQSARA